jgi:hypothetical protein
VPKMVHDCTTGRSAKFAPFEEFGLSSETLDARNTYTVRNSIIA